MKQAFVFNHNELAGILIQHADRSFEFSYLTDSYNGPAVSITLPISSVSYKSERLFGFFDGLIPEGWLLDSTASYWKIDKNDRMDLLLHACKDCIGSVSIMPTAIFEPNSNKQPLLRKELLTSHNAGKPSSKPFVSEYCLCCFERLAVRDKLLHPSCAQLVFDDPVAPLLPIHPDDMDQWVLVPISQQATQTGVQEKVSASLVRDKENSARLTIVGAFGDYILKPPPKKLPMLCVMEQLVMRLAKEVGLEPAASTLLPMADGSLAYVVKRFDRQSTDQAVTHKLAVEDFGQIFGKNQGIDKYSSSYNQIGRWLKQHSSQPGVDLSNFFLQLLFSYVVGNSDLHLKNISVFTHHASAAQNIRLTPLYDLVSVEALEPGDVDQLGLALEGKRAKLSKTDWYKFAEYLGINPKAATNLICDVSKLTVSSRSLVSNSPLPNAVQKRLIALIEKRVALLN